MMTPQLRFPEFTDEWQEKKLGDLAELTSSKRVYLSDYVPHGIPFYRGKEISELKMNRIPDDILYISESAYENFKSKYDAPIKNEILITAVGTLGNILRIRNDEPFYFKDGNLIWLKNITENPYFFEISLDCHKDKLLRSAIGSSQKALTIAGLNKVKLAQPSKPEQQKIADFLTAVNDRITAQQTSLEKLETYKRGMMQKIFSQQFRFLKTDGSEYSGWEMKKAGEIFFNISNRNHSGDLPVLAVTQESGIVVRSDLDRKINQTEAGISNYKIIEPRDFVISLRSFQGGIEMSNVLGISSPAYTVLRGSDEVLPAMFKHYFKRDEFISQLSSTVIGIRDGKQISYGPFSTLKLPVPSLKEQQKIADFLSALDLKITLSRDKLEKTKEFKKGLLQRMFV